jgi:hypothetical protein
MVKNFIPYEDIEQQVLVTNLLKLEKIYPKLLFYAIPNGGWRHKVTAAKLKLMGVMPGVPDLCFPMPRCGYHGLYIELKRQKGGTVSDNQKIWIAALSNNGYRVEVCRGADEAMAVILDYLEGELR